MGNQKKEKKEKDICVTSGLCWFQIKARISNNLRQMNPCKLFKTENCYLGPGELTSPTNVTIGHWVLKKPIFSKMTTITNGQILGPRQFFFF